MHTYSTDIIEATYNGTRTIPNAQHFAVYSINWLSAIWFKYLKFQIYRQVFCFADFNVNNIRPLVPLVIICKPSGFFNFKPAYLLVKATRSRSDEERRNGRRLSSSSTLQVEICFCVSSRVISSAVCNGNLPHTHFAMCLVYTYRYLLGPGKLFFPPCLKAIEYIDWSFMAMFLLLQDNLLVNSCSLAQTVIIYAYGASCLTCQHLPSVYLVSTSIVHVFPTMTR